MPKGYPGSYVHGSDGMYRTAGCRCKTCKDGNTQRHRDYRKKRGSEYVRNANLRHAYGISLGEYNTMAANQNFVCAACFQPEVGRNQYGPLPLAVDHDHTTGQVRGLLCMRCNRSLGLLQDSAENVRSLLTYRERYQ